MKLDRPAAAHLLRRAAVGGSRQQVTSFFNMEHVDAIDLLLDTSVTPAVPPRSFISGEANWQLQEKMIDWWVDRMISAPPTIEEKVMLFLHSHFATAREKVEDAQIMWQQHRLLRAHGLGSFRTLLEKISFDPAMLIYLDNESNVAGAEQENFARELMELHTVGNGRFGEADVIAMAKAWTGHNTVGATAANNWQYDPTYIFRPGDHDNSQKTLFGITRNWDAADTLDELCFGVKATATSDFIARKVFQFFVHSNPAQATVDQLAAGFRANNLNIKKLVRAVLLLDEFWAPETRYALIKSPAEFMVDIMRRCGLTSADQGVRWRMEGMGMTLFDPPSVAGWGRNGFWLGTSSAWSKARWANNLKWRAQDRGLLQGLGDVSTEDAVDAVTDFYGLYEVSNQSVNNARDLLAEVNENYSWAMRVEPFAVGMFMPEVQCA